MRKVLSFILACLMLVSCMSFSAFSADETTETTVKEHWPFGENTKYEIEGSETWEPATFEAIVAFPKEYMEVTVNPETGVKELPGYGGVILGNFTGMNNSCTFCINYGHPQFAFRDLGAKEPLTTDDVVFTYKFTDVDPSEIYCGESVHIAIVRDTANAQVLCYINGEYRQTITDKQASVTEDNTSGSSRVNTKFDDLPFILGGDRRIDNSGYFRGGTLYQVAAYSDIRTAAEIAIDAETMGTGNNLLAHFDLTDCAYEQKEIADETGSVVAKREYKWASAPERGNYAYSVAFLGDTQNMALNAPQNAHYIYDWLINNKESEKIGYVVGLGDVTNDSTKTEFDLMVSEFDRLGEVYGDDYLPIRGNHDFTSVSAAQALAGKQTYDDAFDGSHFADTVPTSQRYQGSLLNCYKTANICGVPYLFLTVNCGPTEAELNWANGVVEDHPNHNVIVATHAYLDWDGTQLTDNDRVAQNQSGTTTATSKHNGDDIWEKFIKKHENICLVASGHIGFDYVVTSEAVGEGENTVVQLLSDHQSVDNTYINRDTVPYEEKGLGIITMLYFMGDGKTVNIETLSSVKAGLGKKKPYFFEKNQFSFEIELNGTRYDVNGNDITDVGDLMLVVDEVLNGTGAVYADVNADGKVSVTDLLRVAKYAAE